VAWISSLKSWARGIRRDVVALYFAARDPRVPWYAKAVAAAVAAYALSPIDPIPDFIPVLGHLDELVVLPLGIMLAVKLIPPELMEEHRAAAIVAESRPKSRVAAAVIVRNLDRRGWVSALDLLARSHQLNFRLRHYPRRGPRAVREGASYG
jgi:uncharacterized membrane protein YkvA (DUF1232 family)